MLRHTVECEVVVSDIDLRAFVKQIAKEPDILATLVLGRLEDPVESRQAMFQAAATVFVGVYVKIGRNEGFHKPVIPKPVD